MMRSLYSGVSGLRNHQTRMDVIGNNIANVNTIGFKSSRVVFQDIYSQTTKGAAAPSETLGGTNPLQIGLGMTLAAVDIMHTRSAQLSTGYTLDCMINGDGFFIVDTPDGSMYTRAGDFYIDDYGTLVNSSGYAVMCLTSSADPTAPTPTDPPDPAVLNANLLKDTDPTADGEYGLQSVNLTGYTSLQIDGTGKISGINPETGAREAIGYIALATFKNTPGLEKVGSSLYTQTSNSGAPNLTGATLNGSGTVVSGGLEMSNVDLSEQFTDMIVTQRGFQANSRVITTSDTMLEELVNLKR